MTRRERVAVGLAIGMLLAACARVQSLDVTVRVGDRIRYRIDGDARTTARVIETGEDWLRVNDGSGPLPRIEKADLSSLEVARGKRRHTVAGAVIGGGRWPPGHGPPQFLEPTSASCRSSS